MKDESHETLTPENGDHIFFLLICKKGSTNSLLRV